MPVQVRCCPRNGKQDNGNLMRHCVDMAWEGDCPGTWVPPASPETGLEKHPMLRWATWVGENPVPLSCHPMTACPILSVPQRKKT
jgi:hypothetical protein